MWFRRRCMVPTPAFSVFGEMFGGFANKLTYEGLYYAIVTGRNASQAIIKGIPFSEANHDIFRRKRREKWITKLFYSPIGLWITKICSRNQSLVKWLFDKGV